MRQPSFACSVAHVAGDKVFVDYSGKRVPIVDPLTGEVRMAELFIAVLGASNLTYADASWTQSLPDWIGAHVRMFRFFGSAPRLLIPDNLKSGVNKPSFYDPEINRSYAKMAAHYNVGVVPARPRKPKDKAAVEAGVRFAQSYILGRLRNVTFFSLAECQAAIVVALERMNGREMRRLGVSRRQLFDTIERPAMQSLPEQDYEYAEWRFARVGIDYHIEVEGFFYSVPHALLREQVDTRIGGLGPAKLLEGGVAVALEDAAVAAEQRIGVDMSAARRVAVNHGGRLIPALTRVLARPRPIVTRDNLLWHSTRCAGGTLASVAQKYPCFVRPRPGSSTGTTVSPAKIRVDPDQRQSLAHRLGLVRCQHPIQLHLPGADPG
jgi:hypothetical protein